MLKPIFLNLKAIYYNNIINFLLFIDIFIPNYFRNNIISYQNESVKCINYHLFLDISEKITKKYNIDLNDLSKKLYNKYISYTNSDNDINISEIDNDDLLALQSDSNFSDYDSE
jgi:hypothetical protein